MYTKMTTSRLAYSDIVKKFSDDIKMELGLEKCAPNASFKCSKLVETSDLQLDDQHMHQGIGPGGYIQIPWSDQR